MHSEPEPDGQVYRERLKRRSARRRARKLERQVEELRLVAMAMFELLMERTSVSNEELISKTEEIDGRDGVVDGRLPEPRARARCPRCDRVLLASLGRCLYCDPRKRG